MTKDPGKQKAPVITQGSIWPRAAVQPIFRRTEYRCYIKEHLHYGAAGADTSSRNKSFVCHTTPHLGNTSREVSYSVRDNHTINTQKSKSLFYKKRQAHFVMEKVVKGAGFRGFSLAFPGRMVVTIA